MKKIIFNGDAYQIDLNEVQYISPYKLNHNKEEDSFDPSFEVWFKNNDKLIFNIGRIFSPTEYHLENNVERVIQIHELISKLKQEITGHNNVNDEKITIKI